MVFKKVIVSILTVILTSCAFAQQINVHNFSTGTYGAGAGISLPIKVSGCFALDNRFELYLSDATGDFTSATKIGTYYGFFTPFINGIIPAGTSAGTNYKLRVVSTNPAVTKEVGPISISASPLAPVANPTSTASNTLYDSTFGRCLITSDQTIVLQQETPTGTTFSATVLDSAGNAVAATVSGKQLQFTMVPGNYYSVTIQIKDNSDKTISTKSFLVLAATNNLSLQTSGANDVCLPAAKTYTVNITGNGGIRFNYPGCKYSIDWGDGTIDTYTHCQLMANQGQLLHSYKTTSCGKPPITELYPVQYNSFRVGVSANNPFCSSSFTALTTYAKAWERPVADFDEVVGCVNEPVTFINTSKVGTAAANNAVNCTDNAVYEWWVDGKLVFNAPKNLVYTFTTLGLHTVRLVAINDPCSDEITKQILVQDKYDFGYKLNGRDSLWGCTPLLVNIDNYTTPPAGINPASVKWYWQVLKRNSITPAVLGQDYIYISTDSFSKSPTMRFIKAGDYRVRLSIRDYACTNYKEVRVFVSDSAAVNLPAPIKRHCDVKTIDFATDPDHKITYSSQNGVETYNWTVSGGAYSFEGGTTNTSAFPRIKFNDYSTYTVTVAFTNGCGTSITPMEISFDRPITALASNDTTLCQAISKLQLSGTAGGPFKSYSWTVVNGAGSLSDQIIGNPFYNFAASDSASVTLRFTVYPVSNSVCTPVSDDVVITLSSFNKVTSADTANICSGSSVNYTPFSTINNSTFNWTSKVVSGTVTGNSATGTGPITEVLVNSSKSATAVVRYTITPRKNACDGEAFSFTVIVAPVPDLNLTVATDTLCNGTNTNIKLSSSYPAALYSWTATGSSSNISGYANQDSAVSTSTISQRLINSGVQNETVTYVIRVHGGTTCAGQTKTVTIVVKPGLTGANAGADQVVCNQAEVTLTGNIPAVGSGSWAQTAGPSTAIVNAEKFQATALGLQPDKVYKYIYTVSGIGSCPPSVDTVVVFNRAKPVAQAGADITVCNFSRSKDSVSLAAKLTHSYETGIWTISSLRPEGSNPVISEPNNPRSRFIFDTTGTYKLIWTTTNDANCNDAADTVLVHVYRNAISDTLSLSAGSVCKGGSVTVTAGKNSGSIKKWQYNPTPFHDNQWIDTVTNLNYLNFNYLTDSIKVRVIVEAAATCSVYDTSKEVTIAIVPLTNAGKTLQKDSVCGGSNNGVITLKGYTGNIKYWESSSNNGTTWSKISDTTSSINYQNLSVTTWYRAIVQSGNCASAISDTAIITVMNFVSQALVGADKTICNNTAVLEANAPGKGESGKWTQLTGPNTAILSTANNPVTTATGLIAGTYKFVWEVFNGACTPTKDTLSIEVRPPVTKANAGNDLVVCDIDNNNSVKLQGNADATRPYEKGTWALLSQPLDGGAAFSNISDPNATFNFKATGVYTLQWKMTNDASCSTTFDTVAVKVYRTPVSGFIKGNTELCVGSDVTISMGTLIGTVQKWQYNPVPLEDNIWRDTLVTSASINFFSIPDSFAVRAIVQSMGWAEGCGATDTSNVLLVNAIPGSVPGTTGVDNTVCTGNNNGVVTLSGNVGDIIRWEYSDNNGANWNVINNLNQSITYKNLLATTWFRAIVQSGLCGNVGSSRTVITVLDSVSNPNAGADQVVCSSEPAALNGSNPAKAEQVKWTQISGSPLILSADDVPNPTINNLKAGAYTFVYTISNGSCPPKSDTVFLKVEGALVNIIDTASKNICAGQTVTIGGEPATGGNGTYNYQWQKSINGVDWSDITGQTNVSLTIVPQADIYVRRVVNSLPCSNISNKAFINVQAAISGNTIIGSDQSICINNAAAILTGSVPGGYNATYQYQWQRSTDNGGTWINIPNATGKDYDPGIVTISTKYRRNISAMLCTGPQSNISNVIDIIVNPNASADFVAVRDTACPVFTLDKNIIKTVESVNNKLYNWYGNGNYIGSGVNFPGYVLSNGGDSVSIKLVTTSMFGCRPDSIQHAFYTRYKPTADFTLSDTVGCGPLLVKVTNNTPNQKYFQYKWNFGTGQTSTAGNPGSIIFPANPNYGDTTYKVSLTVFSECDSMVVTKNVLVHSKVKAVFSPDNTFACSPSPVTFTNNSKGAIDFTWDFGDGTIVNTTSTQTMVHTYASNVRTTFIAKLIARSVCGIDTQRYSIVVSPNHIKLLVSVNGPEKFGCTPHVVNFMNNTTGATLYRWDFGDGNFLTTTGNNDTIPHLYENAGTYNIKVFASNNCSDTTGYITVTVLPKPKVDFSSIPVTACIGDSVRFTNLTDTSTNAVWNFGDGTTSKLINPVHRYTTAGIYNVTLHGIRQYPSGNACIDSITKTVTVVASLPANFTATDTINSCAPSTVTFRNLNLPAANTVWDFGDGNKGAGDVVTHTYTIAGTYKATMSAVTSAGCKYDGSKTIVVQGPRGTWQYDEGIVCGTRPIRFEALAVGVDSFKYSFGDGTVVVTTNTVVYHTYKKSGTYLPKLEMLSGAGCKIVLQGTDTIKVEIIKAGFSTSLVKECGQTKVVFNDTTRSNFGLRSSQWTFGDGQTSNLRNPEHSYTSANTYPVKLITVGTMGCADTISLPLSIPVNDMPIVSVIADSVACVRSTVSYNSSIVSRDSISFIYWRFSNGATSNNLSYVNRYGSPGNHLATLVVSTVNGCSDTATKPILINPAPFVKTIEDRSICMGQSLPLTVTGSTNYTWSPANTLSCQTCSNPVASPTQSTTYTVSSVNSYGCMGVDTVRIAVQKPFKMSVSPADTVCKGETAQLRASGADMYKWFPGSTLSSTDVANPIALSPVSTAYRVVGSDSAGCYTDTAYVSLTVGEVPTVELGPDKVLPAGTLLPLTSVVTNGPISKWDWKPYNDLTCSNCAEPVATIKRDINYSVKVTNIYGCTATDTIRIKVFCESTQVFIPNVFTPDNDGVNDVLMVRGTGIKTVKSFRVFTRWGELVFERSNFSPNEKASGWDGTIRGVPAPPEVYVYTCDVLCENDNSYIYKGNVAIIK